MFHHRRPLGRALLIVLLPAVMIVSGAFAAAAIAAPGDAQLSMGDTFSMLIKPDGSLYAWGNNQYGQLGLDTFATTLALRVGSETDWANVATGSVHTIAVKTDGTLWAWGNNAFGQLGLGDLVDRDTPTQVGTDTDWAAVAGGAALLVRTEDRRVTLGLGPERPTASSASATRTCAWPRRVSAWTPTGRWSTAVGSSPPRSRRTARLWAWGRNDNYELGQGDVTDRHVPTQIGTDTDWSRVGSSNRDSRALKNDGTLWAWGYNHYGQLGLGDVVTRHVPTEVVGASWDLLSAGDDSTFATQPDGSLWAWGDNTYGQLGQGDYDHRSVPTRVGTGTDWAIVCFGNDHGGAVKSDGGLWMWGKNTSAQLGLGDTYESPASDVRVLRGRLHRSYD